MECACLISRLEKKFNYLKLGYIICYEPKAPGSARRRRRRTRGTESTEPEPEDLPAIRAEEADYTEPEDCETSYIGIYRVEGSRNGLYSLSDCLLGND